MIGVVLGYTGYVALNQTATICRPTVGPTQTVVNRLTGGGYYSAIM